MKRQLYSNTHNSCGCSEEDGYFFLSKKINISINADDIIDQVIKNVHEGDKNTPKQDRILVQENYSKLREALKEGGGKLSTEVQYGGANLELLKNLQYNVGVFSALKKHDMVRELVKNLKDENGRLKPYNEYRKDAMKLVSDYRERYNRTEYNTAVRMARSAAQWTKYELTKRIYPNLRYTLTKSVRKRIDHESWVGTVLPKDHPWWTTHFPPNDWDCKCGTEETDDAPTEVVPAGSPAEGFEFNPGIDGKVFDVEKHPYAQLPNKEYQVALSEARGALCSYERTNVYKQAVESKIIEKEIKVDRLPAPVQLNRNSYMKNLEYGQYFFEKLNILNNIEEVLKESTYLYPENRTEKQHVKQYHLLQYGKGAKVVHLHVEERKDGSMFLYYIHIQKNHQ